MSSPLAPLWALAAEAIDGIGDTHLPPGVHVRALPSPQLGLPSTPLVVTRAVLTGERVRRLAYLGGVIWVDSFGVTRTEPFTVTPDNPVTGYFPKPRVIYAELLATPAQSATRATGQFSNIAELLAAAGVGELGAPHPIGQPAELASLLNRIGAELAAHIGIPASLRFEALANSVMGPAAFQTRVQAPYALAAWTIPLVRVVGSGTVNGIRWLDTTRADKELKESFWELWSLPVDPAPRYSPTASAHFDAADRVRRCAVTRQPMFVAYAATSPATAPPATPADAQARVDEMRGQIDTWLKALLNDLSKPPAALLDTQAITGQNGSLSLPILPFLIAGAVDPDVGHYLGFGDVDQTSRADNGSLVFYRIRGLWRWTESTWNKVEVAYFTAAIRANADAAVPNFEELRQYNIIPKEQGPFVDLSGMAVALYGTPPSPPLPISLDAATDRGWLATPPPPNVRRALRLQASGFIPHSVAALAATDSNGDRTLHPFPKVGRAIPGHPLPHGTPLPLVVSRPQDALGPGEGRFEDRDAPESAILYRLAQGDWFGRWSGWHTRLAPAKARTPPMRPVLELYPQPPIVPTPVPNTPLQGTILVRIAMPKQKDLPAGGAALARLDLDETFAGDPTTTTSYTLASLSGAATETDAVSGQTILVITRAGPALDRAAQRAVIYTARWVDVLNLVSANADPATRTMIDPRPPPAPPVITELRYTARPDAEGHARVDLDFGTIPGTRYRVYASTETTLLKALDATGQASAAAAIRDAAPGAPRAMAFKTNKALFGWDHFENLTPDPIIASGTTTHFVHRISGSLEVLAIYRVLSEGPSGQLSEMTEADLVPFAVPNLGGPSRPQAALISADLDPTIQGVKLRVKVPIGKAVPKAWRLRRASAPVRDPLRMNIVATGPVSSVTTDSTTQSFELGATAPLKAWRHYQFAVEVQADDPPGAPTVGIIPAGEWSQASVPVSLAVIPPAGPAQATGVHIQNVAGALSITVTHPDADTLIGTALGPYRFEVWRCEPNARPAKVDVAFARSSGLDWIGSTPNPSASGAYVSLRIIDPIGRRSEARISNQI